MMVNNNVFDNLKEKIIEMTNSERKVADYIIKNPSEVTFDTVNELSKKVGTSTTTIMRLAVKLGYTGYSELQHDIQNFMKDKAAPQARLISNLKNVEEDELWTQTVGYHVNQINQLVSQLDPNSLEDTVELIEKSNKIYCTCVRSGLPVGQYFSQNINRISGNCRLIVADVSDWVDEIVSMNEGDLLVTISFPRYAKRINDFVKIAKEKGVKVIVITDTYSSPLIDYGEVVLTCDSNSLAFHNSPITALVVVDYIINALAIKESYRESNRLEEINNILKRINYHSK